MAYQHGKDQRSCKAYCSYNFNVIWASMLLYMFMCTRIFICVEMYFVPFTLTKKLQASVDLLCLHWVMIRMLANTISFDQMTNLCTCLPSVLMVLSLSWHICMHECNARLHPGPLLSSTHVAQSREQHYVLHVLVTRSHFSAVAMTSAEPASSNMLYLPTVGNWVASSAACTIFDNAF